MSIYSDTDETEHVVFDIGSHTARIGIAGDDAPAISMNYWESPDFRTTYFENGYKLWKNAQYDSNVLENVIESCHDQLSKKLNGKFDAVPALFTEHLYDCPTKREILFEIMFEKFGIPSTYIAPSPILSLYSSGRGSGIVIESGNSVTETLVIYDGFVIHDSVKRQDYGGATFSLNLKNGFENGNMSARDNPEFVISLKNQCSLDLRVPSTEIKLPDGSVVAIDSSLVNESSKFMFESPKKDGIDELIYQGIMASDIHCRRDLFCNIILSGGNTLASGFTEKLSDSFEKLFKLRHAHTRFKVVSSPERLYSPWIGGSILASLSTMEYYWIKKAAYDECGAKGLHDRLINP